MVTKKPIGSEISSADILKLTNQIAVIIKEQGEKITLTEGYLNYLTHSIIRAQDVPSHIDRLLRGEETTVLQEVYIEGKKISSPRTQAFRVNSIPLGTDNGFIVETCSRPLPAIVIYTQEKEELILNINITENYYVRHTQFQKENPHVLAQLIMHELYEQIEGLSHIESVLIESKYNSFETATNQVSDLSRDILEGAAKDSDFTYLQKLVNNTEHYKKELKKKYTNQLPKEVISQAGELAEKIKIEAQLLLQLHHFKLLHGEKCEIKPQNILSHSRQTAIMGEDGTTVSFRLPTCMKDVISDSLKEFNTEVFTARTINAYIQPKDTEKNRSFYNKIRKWVETFIEFSEVNSYALRCLGTKKYDPSNIFHTIKQLLSLHHEITGSENSFVNELSELQKCQDDQNHDTISRFINGIHREVLDSIFGVFKTSTGKKLKECYKEIESISGTIISLLINESDNYSIRGYGFVRVIDLEDTFNRETSIGREIASRVAFVQPWRRSTNIYSIFAGTKAWFFADLGIHTANVFIDINPLDRKIDIDFAELENTMGNQMRLNFVTELLETIMGIKAKTTDLSVSIRLDKSSKNGPISINGLIHKTSRVLQGLTYLVDLDEYLATGEIPYNALIGQIERLSTSDTGFPLYSLRQKYFLPADKKRHAINTKINTILNEKLAASGLEKLPEDLYGQDYIDQYFNKALLDYKPMANRD